MNIVLRVALFAPYRFLVALVCAGSGLVLSAQGTRSHIRAVETGLGPEVTISGRPTYRRDLIAEMQRLHVPAVSIALIHDGKIEWAKGYGTQGANGAPVMTATLFQAASLSKGLSAMAALKLVQQHRLSLDAPVNTELKSWVLPETSFSVESPVTLRELLSHTGGISVHGFAGYAVGQPVPTLVQILRGEKPANSPPIMVVEKPGDHFIYSGGGYVIAQQMMIERSGETFPALMDQLVLAPLGLKHSTFQQPLDRGMSTNVALPVDCQGNSVRGGPHTYPEMAAAGLWTTPSDLAKWLIELQGSITGKANHILSLEMTRTMLTPVKDGYALGVGTQALSGKPVISHWGANEGYRCMYFAYQDGDGVVIMTNSDGGDVLAGELLGSVAREYHWPDFQQK